jgi:hypothetical protein
MTMTTIHEMGKRVIHQRCFSVSFVGWVMIPLRLEENLNEQGVVAAALGTVLSGVKTNRSNV